MKALEFLNQLPPVIRDNHNRDSSACKSRAGYVIHSGVHRSTAFVSLPHAVASLESAKALGQAALNGWIEATIDSAELSDCELTAVTRAFPDWTFSTLKNGGACRNSHKQAVKHERGFQTIHSAGSWYDLAEKLR